MLIEFSVGNFLSIKDRQTLRLDASSISEHRDQLIDAGRYQLLRSAVIYGANASGKSNVLKAMATMREIVTTSARHSSRETIGVQPFRLSTETESKPSYFEVLFLLDGIRYRYGFEADPIAVRSEWLFIARKEREKPLFLRGDYDKIEVFKDFKEGKGLENKTRSNALFLAVCDQFNGVVAKQIITWFNKWLAVSGLGHESYRPETYSLLSNHNHQLIYFLRQLDLGFNDVNVHNELELLFNQSKLNKLHTEQGYNILQAMELDNKPTLLTTHLKYNSSHIAVNEEFFNVYIDESAGTQKLFDLVGPIFQILSNGCIIIVDELDAKLHPLMTQAIIKLFNQPELNPNNAQLIFATHDTNLLSGKLFRRDQIYFTEKDQYGATSLYSLVEYQEEDGTKVRKDRSFEEDYIRGRYGAIPFIGDLSKIAS